MPFWLNPWRAFNLSSIGPSTLAFLTCLSSVPLLRLRFYDIWRLYRPSAPRPSLIERGQVWFCVVCQCSHGFLALLGVVRHNTWTARNFYRFDGISPEPLRSLKIIKSSIRFVLWVQRRYCALTVFESQWLAGGVLGSLAPNGSLSFPDALS